jgi:hypothetical protein
MILYFIEQYIMYIYICGINAMDAIFLIHLCDDCYKLFNISIFSITHEMRYKIKGMSDS